MNKNTGKSSEYTTVGDLFDKTIDKMFQDKNFLDKFGKQDTNTSSSRNTQGQVSKNIKENSAFSVFFLGLELVFW